MYGLTCSPLTPKINCKKTQRNKEKKQGREVMYRQYDLEAQKKLWEMDRELTREQEGRYALYIDKRHFEEDFNAVMCNSHPWEWAKRTKVLMMVSSWMIMCYVTWLEVDGEKHNIPPKNQLRHPLLTQIEYFWFKYNLGQKYCAPQVRSDPGSNSWPPDHDSRFPTQGRPEFMHVRNYSPDHWFKSDRQRNNRLR